MVSCNCLSSTVRSVTTIKRDLKDLLVAGGVQTEPVGHPRNRVGFA